MDTNELLKQVQALLVENRNLKEEIKSLRILLDGKITENEIGIDGEMNSVFQPEPVLLAEESSPGKILISSINKSSSPEEKIKLFMSLFKGRDDVYARRWENSKKGTSGYSPVCANEWEHGICQKPKTKCTHCKHKDYLPLDEGVFNDHLRGNGNIVAGIYPMRLNETCCFLAIDFDNEGWQKDISTLRGICSEFNIPAAIERSRSGNGAHAWFFFDYPIAASLARKFGSAMLTYAMGKRHEITFASYDRLFPNQDTMPKGGFGNLIALPLQKAARKNSNSVFVNNDFQAYDDQWAFLSSIERLSEDDVQLMISKLCNGNELGPLKIDSEEISKPWEKNKLELQKNDFPKSIEIVKANMLFVPKIDISQRALNRLKRLAAFSNPEFYKAQAMRMPTFNKPRIVSCSDETTDYLCLPRGCETDLSGIFNELKVKISWADKTNTGRKIDVEFVGNLRDGQPEAVIKLLEYDNGILCGTTAFGKTVAAIKLIAERKVNTLILVNKINLLSQWKDKISEFLKINETLSVNDNEPKKVQNKNRNIIGQLGGGKHTLNGIIDIAVMQSLNRMGEVLDCVRDYGMVIVDECHHVSAFSFETILKNVNAKFVHGLTATPTRKDGHHPIIFMQCGPIRYRDDAKQQADKRPFEHYIVPRFTSFRVSLDKEEKEVGISELYAAIVENELRNQMIVDDVVRSYENGNNCIVLTERTAHVAILAKEIGKRIPDLVSVTGGMGAKNTREKMAIITDAPIDKPLTIVATGRYIGEGFDEPRLDTLFLAMPISWKGTLQQYAGRLHRLFEGKSEALIYDYVDVHVRMFEKMYNKRLSGYASIGYKVKGESFTTENANIIFDKSNFLPVFSNDIVNVSREILIVSPFVTQNRTIKMIKILDVAMAKNVKVIVVTRPSTDFENRNLISWKNSMELLKEVGVSIIFKSNIHQKFAIMDQKIVWYGSINLLSFGSAEESIMRLESPNIANELIRSTER